MGLVEFVGESGRSPVGLGVFLLFDRASLT